MASDTERDEYISRMFNRVEDSFANVREAMRVVGVGIPEYALRLGRRYEMLLCEEATVYSTHHPYHAGRIGYQVAFVG